MNTYEDEEGITRVERGVLYAPFVMKGLVSPYYPVNYFVFAIDSMNLRTISDRMAERIRTKQLPIHQRLDMVCVLNRGLISNRTTDKPFDALPADDSAIVDSAISRPLAAFFALMCQPLLQASAPKFDFGRYFTAMNFNPQPDA